MQHRRRLCFEQLGDRQVLSANLVAEFATPGDDAVRDVECRTDGLEQEAVELNVIEGSDVSTPFTPGATFKINQHPRDSEVDGAYVIVSVQHSANESVPYQSGQAGADYHNTFSSIPDSVIYRAPRITPAPWVSGVPSAVAVSSAGEEIDPDSDGRVKVQFSWDRDANDEDSSCWIRVSQVHAGPGYGAFDVAATVDKVFVDPVEGNPDRPIIVGRVYNAENMPPFGLPGASQISGMKSNSVPAGGDYAMDDTKGNELIREHGQFDMDSTVEHDLREHVLNNRTLTVGSNKTNTVGSNETINVGAAQQITVGAAQDSTAKATKDLILKGKTILQN